ncbi:class I SAM-dependent methyltransferase [Thioflexithrix psekupsensis]|uniref:Methyltransferase domain-containing protein n=1 Tax=Thioflexithrix psekupsensis TaxID=1570016 RepID=A0A251X7T0_9GAMM|nr:class I SAM-dependent methyltransferase [Thioflexithrix psekupsensis]OUD13844.1 hypothetical protein TPSD3_05715 [Thioflexithrix psekupsensis]
MSEQTYNELLYDCVLGYEFQPSELAIMSRLFGLNPPPVATARILDIGCGDGTHIIGVAQSLPNSHCVGIDYAANAIAIGQKTIDDIGLKNVTLHTANLCDLQVDLGQFDYITAHGFYSWVSEEVQQALLRFCQQHLSENGLVYLSYNTLPGWHAKNMVRDMMKHHVSPSQSLSEQAQSARQLIQFAAQLHQEGKNYYAQFLTDINAHLSGLPDSYIVHEYLAEENHPVYFQDFMRTVSSFQLNYVTDIEFKKYQHLQLKQFLEEQLQVRDALAQEQYVDFLFKREFRSSILCRQGITVAREPQLAVLENVYYAAELGYQVNPNQADTLTFNTAKGQRFDSNDSLLNAALSLLAEHYPRRLSFAELLQQACQRLNVFLDYATFSQQLLPHLWQLYLIDAISLYTEAQSPADVLSEYPVASPLARWQARQGKAVANLLCKTGELDPLALSLLAQLDGSKTKTDLIEGLVQQWQRGELNIGDPNAPQKITEEQARATLAPFVEQMLVGFLRNALLIA